MQMQRYPYTPQYPMQSGFPMQSPQLGLRQSIYGGYPQRYPQYPQHMGYPYAPQYAPQYPQYQYPQYQQQPQYLQPRPTQSGLPVNAPQNLRNSFFPQYQQQFNPQHFSSRLVIPPQAQGQLLQSPQRQVLGSPARQNLPQHPGQRVVLTSPAQKAPTGPVKPRQPSGGPHKAVPQIQEKPKQAPAEKQVEDLDKRFAEAIKRSKQIVEQHQQAPAVKEREVYNITPYEQAPQPEKAVDEQDELEELALQYEDGFIYRGQGYQPATRHGYGILTDANDNEVYAGNWDNNQYEGDGRLNNLQQEQLDEPIDWTNMQSIENGWANYEGNFHQGKMHGQGQLTLTNGERYNGEFVDGMVEGRGEFYTANNEVYKGVWSSGVLQEQL